MPPSTSPVTRMVLALLPAVAVLPAFLLLAACGDDDNGNGDTLLTGFSGLVILIIVVWLVVRAFNNRR